MSSYIHYIIKIITLTQPHLKCFTAFCKYKKIRNVNLVGLDVKKYNEIHDRIQNQFKMIFPKQQMTFAKHRSQPIKKQALELMIDLYLNRKGDEDIDFLSKNFGSTHGVIASIGSSELNGLSAEEVKNSRLIYGQNEKKAPLKCLTLPQCLKKQMLRPKLIISLALLFSTLIFGAVQNVKQLLTSALIMILFSLIVPLLRALTLFISSQKLSGFSQNKTKNNIYLVVRDGQYIEVQQWQIVVGDIVELGFKQKVPATGILISDGQVFVKEGKKQTSQVKLTLERCLDRIQGMGLLDLKLSFEKSTLPSPIILRGSELMKGKTYSVLIISVTQEDLLNEFKILAENKFESRAYDQWVKNIEEKWSNWTLFFAIVTTTFLILGSLTGSKLFASSNKINIQVLFQLKLKISIIMLVLQVNPLCSFLNIIWINLINELKINQNLEKLFTVKRILCNQRKIVERDQVNAVNIAVCDKSDLISFPEVKCLHPLTFNLVEHIQELFNVSDPELGSPKKNKCRKIVHVYKKDLKIISSIYAPSNQKVLEQSSGSYPGQNYLNPKFQKVGEHRTSFTEKKEQQKKIKRLSENVKTPKLEGLKQIQNLKQIINSRCRVKSKLVLDGLAGLAENGLKTFYYETFDLKNLEQMTHVLTQGSIRPMQIELKQRMLMLSRKMNLVYGLTPILISYHEGSFQSTTSRTLICMMGVEVVEKNQIISCSKELQQAGIKTTIVVNKFEHYEDDAEETLLKEYVHRGWIDPFEGSKIKNALPIKQMLKRLVCKQCLIANCGCRDKIEVIANIQPFIEISQRAKIIYDVQLSDYRSLQSAYTQVENNLISINSPNCSAPDYLTSIYSCQKFVTKLRRSLIFFYAVSITYFSVPILFWMRNLEAVSSLQMGFSFLLISLFFFYNQLFKVQGAVEKTPKHKGAVKILTKECVLVVYAICLMVVIGSQILYLLHYQIPEFEDSYDALIKKQGLDFSVCKYGPNNSLTNQFMIEECKTAENGEQFSRLSTLITAYCYFCIWSLAVLINRNFRSVWSLIFYASSLCIFVLILEKMSWLIHGYSYGLNSKHYLILMGATIVTLVTGGLLGYLTSKLPFCEYICRESQNGISFEGTCQNDYISKLKSYSQIKRRQTLQTMDQEFRNSFQI